MVDGRGGRRRLRHSDLTDPFRTLARRLGVRGGEVRSAEATRRYHAATSGAQRALADQLDQRPYLDDPDTLVMGVESYFAPDVHKYRGDTNKVVIGNWCSIAADADFYVGGMHPIEWVTTFGIREMFMLDGGFRPPMPRSYGDIVVGHDCWITEGSTVLSGVTIGNGAVVATKAVVTKDVRPYAIVAGNPAQEIGRRFDDGQIAALERIRWWDWDVPTVIDRVADLNGATVDDFIATYDPGRSGVE